MTTVPALTLNDQTTIPQLGFGVWQVSTDDIVPAVSKALEVGYRHLDTAAVYGNEEGVGRAIAESGIPRGELYVTTKLWNDRHTDAESALAESLEKLGLDQVDLYLIHWPAPAQGRHVDAWESLVKLREQGLTRSIGVSNFHQPHLRESIEATGVVPAVNQVEIHPTFTQKALIRDTRALGIDVEAWSPLGQAQDLESEEVVAIAERLERTPAQVILRWHLQQGRIVFPKSITPARIEENFDVLDFALSDDDLTAIDSLDRGNRIGPDPDRF